MISKVIQLGLLPTDSKQI